LGLFINTLPLYLRLEESSPLVQWLLDQQAAQAEQDAHGHVGLSDIQAYIGQVGKELFEAMFIYENYANDSQKNTGKDLNQTGSENQDGTHYTISLLAMPGTKLLLRLTFNRARLDDAQAADLLARLSQLIEALPVIAKTPLAAIPLTTLS
ncbi:hypothetical protein ICN41_11200, partial [Polynucleobacter sp. 15G-AUS-farblos]|uniref:condensation domain-containing protein n=1 Tax=Polynucleobacter sp. 15G-AUS-farblos TaxID=2689094 RepID=UPI001C0B6D4B